MLALGRAAVRIASDVVTAAMEHAATGLVPWLRQFWTGVVPEPLQRAVSVSTAPPARVCPPDQPGGAAEGAARPVRATAPPGSTGLPRVPAALPPGRSRQAAPPRAGDGVDRAGLLPRDPYWLFAFWDVRPRTRIEALRALGDEAEGAVAVLRVFEQAGTLAERPCFDVDLTPGADRWYVQVPRDDAAYAVEVGLRTLSGRFFGLVRSDVARTPPAHPSEQVVVEWYAAPPPPPPEPTILQEPIEPEEAPPPPDVPIPAWALEASPPDVLPEPAPAPGPAPVAAGPVGPAETAVPAVDVAALLEPDVPRSSEALQRR